MEGSGKILGPIGNDEGGDERRFEGERTFVSHVEENNELEKLSQLYRLQARLRQNY